IDAESPEQVLSDDTIVEKLREAGIDIARRTVAKYREAMRIASSVQRRREKQTSLGGTPWSSFYDIVLRGFVRRRGRGRKTRKMCRRGAGRFMYAAGIVRAAVIGGRSCHFASRARTSPSAKRCVSGSTRASQTPWPNISMAGFRGTPPSGGRGSVSA